MNEPTAPYFVAIGASGSEGLDDIGVLLHSLWQPCPAIVMVVLHRPSNKVSHLREVLARGCTMPIVIASEAERLIPGTCYIGEPDGHLTLMAQEKAHLVPGMGSILRGQTIDVLFDSLALHAGKQAIGIILSGSASDGSRGMAAINHAGGCTMVLDPGQKVRGMQQNAIEFNGPISFIGKAREIADKIDQIVAGGIRASASL